ncbi:MAG: 50S ribosomal protein L7/L12 [Mycoplasmataceae bacterium]|nr:MAG: 50S ribosomal protein L7/L12 [Mycoplasmataceae bacterium]
MEKTIMKQEDIINSILNGLNDLNLPNLSKLNEMIREKFGLSDINFSSSNGEEEKKEDKKTTVSLVLKKVGDQRIPVFNAIKEMIGKSILEVKKLTDTLPFVILSDLNQQKAEELKAQLEAQGAEVEIK